MRSGLVLTCLFLITACGGPPDDSAGPTPAGPDSPAAEGDREGWPDSLVLGLVPSREAGALIESAEPLTAALTAALGIEVEGFVPQNYTGLVEAMGAGQADIGAFGPFGLVQAQERHGVEIILQSERFGSATYHTQWLTNDPATFCEADPVADDDGFLGCNGTVEAQIGPVGEDHLADVAGATVAYVEPTSASGYIFPAVQLLEAGVDPQQDVESVFAGSHDAAVLAVYDGDAAVAVSFDDARGQLAEEFPDVGEKVVSFAYSPEIPNDGWAIRAELPDSLRQAITQALLDYAATDAGMEVLNSIYEIDTLVPADLESFEIVRQAAAQLDVPIED
jgi:phosphonate transport system substrate-binding protein